jgi:adenine-specific DNA-methyltransferase
MNISETILRPIENEPPSSYANRLGEYYSSMSSQSEKKEKGQFFTPLEISYFMASLFTTKKNRISILDPGCGTGILSISLIEHIVNTKNDIETFSLVAYETDNDLLKFCSHTYEYLREWLDKKNISFTYKICNSDFILDFEYSLKYTNNLFESKLDTYDFIISNPPYFKLPKEDKRTLASKEVVNGHANIYSIFMAISASILKSDGQLVFITPRSFSSGNYFHKFRNYFFNRVDIAQAHLFHSRKNTFNKDNVLQETLILKCVPKDKSINRPTIIISSSDGIKDLNNPSIAKIPSDLVMEYKSVDKVLFLPTNQEEKIIVELFRSYEGSLNKYGFQISTGPVVGFRATQYILENEDLRSEKIAPLYWLHNVSKMTLDWPINKPNKGQYISVCNASMPLLVQNKNYIFLRRFSSKDDKSRLIAAPYLSNAIESKFIGIENKLNYIYKPHGHMDRLELIGLSAILNSELFDKFFRILNGNVNVSSTELRLIPLPPLDIIKEIGNELILLNIFDNSTINHLVNERLQFIPVPKIHE